MFLRIAHVASDTRAEGPGRRFALWFQGCPLRCPGCCNPEFLPFAGGQLMALDDLWRQVQVERSIEGITLLGGEPFAHAEGAAAIAERAREAGLSVMVFSGYTLEQIHDLPPPADRLLALIDLLVDGPYERDRPDQRRRWIGSTNQRIHFLTERYRADDPCWTRPNTLEIRLDATGLAVNGFPAIAARDFWRGPRHG
jgi:anaerobic ribonucleoside-triphosphate reductase activating protein